MKCPECKGEGQMHDVECCWNCWWCGATGTVSLRSWLLIKLAGVCWTIADWAVEKGKVRV